MFNPDEDLAAIWRVVATDTAILGLLGLADATDLEKRKCILKRSRWDDLVAPTRRLNIYFRPSRRARNAIITQEVVQIDCHVPELDDHIAYRVMHRLRGLLHDRKIGKRYLEFDGQLGELPTMPGFFSAGIRFRWFGVI